MYLRNMYSAQCLRRLFFYCIGRRNEQVVFRWSV